MTVPHPERVHPRTIRKARARHAAGRVRFLPHARTYAVEGDTRQGDSGGAIYKVTVEHEAMSCDCPARGGCWHVQAVREARKAGTEPAHNLEIGTQP